MKIRTARWVAATALGLAAAIAGACGSDPQFTKVDEDEDGFIKSQDCDDDDTSVNPNAAEDCTDGEDNDCDGKVDGADTECGAPTGSSGSGGMGWAGGGGGAGGGGPCGAKCGEAVTNGQPLCMDAPPMSVQTYTTFVTCACGSDPVNSKCTAACMNEFCPSKNMMDLVQGSACQMCLGNSMTGCGSALIACSNDPG